MNWISMVLTKKSEDYIDNSLISPKSQHADQYDYQCALIVFSILWYLGECIRSSLKIRLGQTWDTRELFSFGHCIGTHSNYWRISNLESHSVNLHERSSQSPLKIDCNPHWPWEWNLQKPLPLSIICLPSGSLASVSQSILFWICPLFLSSLKYCFTPLLLCNMQNSVMSCEIFGIVDQIITHLYTMCRQFILL